MIKTKRWMIFFMVLILLLSPNMKQVKAETNERTDASITANVTGNLVPNATISIHYMGSGIDTSDIRSIQITSLYDQNVLKKVTCYSTVNASFHDTSSVGMINLVLSSNQDQSIDGNRELAVCQFQIKASGNATITTELSITKKDNSVTTLPSYMEKLAIEDKEASDASLKDITLSKGTLSPTFNANTLSYTVEVDSSVKEVTIKVTKQNPDQSVEEEKTVSLNDGVNTVSIPVIAKDGSKKTYQIKITRKSNKSSDASLQNLYIKGITFNEKFNPKTKTYTATVPYEVEKVYVQAKTSNAKASILVTGATNLTSGKTNVIYVTVTAENGSKETYLIKLTRKTKSDGTTVLPPSNQDKDKNQEEEKDKTQEEKDEEKHEENKVDKPDDNKNSQATIIEGDDDKNPVKQLVLIAGMVTLVGLSGIAVYHYIKKPKENSYDE